MSEAWLTDNSDEDHDLIFKLLLIGDSGVGKTSILVRFVEDEFKEDQSCTIGVDFKSKKMILRGKKVLLTIWDTAGQEKFRSLTSSYYRGTEGIILVYDVTDRNSFKDIDMWLREISMYATKQDVIKLLVGNKEDLPNREVSKEEAREFAREKGLAMYIETSAKTKIGIKQAFEELVEKIYEHPDLYENQVAPDASLKISSTSEVKKESGCVC